MTDELVALYDPASGEPAGSAPRSRVRRENLPHGATGILVRRSSAEVFVHRRSDAKDLWPGYHDCAAGGVLLAGEDPAAGAARELAEELGIPAGTGGTGPPTALLTPLLQRWYRDDATWYRAFVFEAVWDGDVSFDDGEVAAGWWEPMSVLRARLADRGWPFVPDTRRLLDLLPDWPAAGTGSG